ncbi:hypothetical protein OAT84_00420 [Gammaproteobacteria bacterium]|nr:hypothetical protein [Gammaproteobacteria bacterium]
MQSQAIDHAAMANISTMSPAHLSLTEGIIEDFSNFLSHLTYIPQKTLNPLSFWDKLVLTTQSDQIPPVKAFLDSINPRNNDHILNHQVYRPIKNATENEKRLRQSFQSAAFSRKAEIIQQYLTAFEKGTVHSPLALWIYLDHPQQDELVEVIATHNEEQSSLLASLYQINNRLKHPAFQRLPLTQLLQFVRPYLNKLSYHDVLSVLAFQNIKCLEKYKKQILEKQDYALDALSSQSFMHVIDNHPMKLLFIQHIQENKLSFIANVLTDEICQSSDAYELQSVPTVECLPKPLINTLLESNNISEHRESINTAIANLITTTQQAVAKSYQSWQKELYSALNESQVNWHHALNTLWFFHMYIAASTRYLTPDEIQNTNIRDLPRRLPLIRDAANLDRVINTANKLLAKLENNPCIKTVNALSTFFPGSTSATTHPQYFQTASRLQEIDVISALRFMFSAHPTFKLKHSPTHTQLGFANILVEYFIPNSTNSATALQTWAHNIYLSTEKTYAKKIFLQGYDHLQSQLKTQLAEARKKLTLNESEQHLLMLSLLFASATPETTNKSTLQEPIDHLFDPIFCRPKYWTLNLSRSLPICNDWDKVVKFHAVVSNSETCFSKGLKDVHPFIYGCSSVDRNYPVYDPAFAGVQKLFSHFEEYQYQITFQAALLELYLKRTQSLLQKSLSNSTKPVIQLLASLWDTSNMSLSRLFRHTLDNDNGKDKYQQASQLKGWLSDIETAPYLDPTIARKERNESKHIAYIIPENLDPIERCHFALPEKKHQQPLRTPANNALLFANVRLLSPEDRAKNANIAREEKTSQLCRELFF